MDNLDSNGIENEQDAVREDWADANADLPRAGNPNNGGQGAEAMVMGPRTDANTHQADAPAGGHAIDSAQSGSSTDQPGQVAEPVVHPAGMDDSAMQSVAHPNFGLHVLASGAMLMDQGGEQGSEFGLWGTTSPYLFGGRV